MAAKLVGHWEVFTWQRSERALKLAPRVDGVRTWSYSVVKHARARGSRYTSYKGRRDPIQPSWRDLHCPQSR